MVPRIVLVAGAVAIAIAAGFATANSSVAANRCILSAVSKLHGHVSLTLNESATAKIPGTEHHITLTLSRQASDVSVHLTKQRSNKGGYYVFLGGSSGGSFSVNDTYSSDGGQSGKLTANGPVHSLTAGLAGHPNTCLYQLSVAFWTRAAFSGNFDGSPYTTGISDSLLTRRLKASKLAGSALVPVDWDGCGIDYGSAGCVGYSGGWSNDFTMFKRCGTTSAGTCPSAEDTDFGDATISWSLSLG